MTAKVYRFPRTIRIQSLPSLMQTLAEEADWLAIAADTIRLGHRLDRVERDRLQVAITRLELMRVQLHG